MSGMGVFVIVMFLIAVAGFTAILAYCSLVDGGATHGTGGGKAGSAS